MALWLLFSFWLVWKSNVKCWKVHYQAINKAIFPAIAAIGGMVVPALIYFMVAQGTPEIYSGWAIPIIQILPLPLASLLF